MSSFLPSLSTSLALSLCGTLSAKEPPRHIAFQPIVRPAVPRVENPTSPVRNSIDAFTEAKRQAKLLTASPEADRGVLVRRLFLDLTGLPPTPEEVEQARNDQQEGWYERLVERLLASPHHGERWARHWLDVARWAESEGYESNHPRPYSWRYRDYVVNAFNRDTPYDVFIRQQIAGDEMTPHADENLIATGFLAAARISSNEEDKWRQRNDTLVDIVNATASAFLGLTLHCAQCHNHKLEPLSQRDYYRFQGFFVKGHPGQFALKDAGMVAAYENAKPKEFDALAIRQMELFEKGRAWLIGEAKKKMTPEMLRVLNIPEGKRTDEEERRYRQADLLLQFTPERVEKNIPESDRKTYQEVKKRLDDLRKSMPERPQTFAFYSPVSNNAVEALPVKGFFPIPYEPEKLKSSRAYLLHGGDVHRRGAALDPGWPTVLGEVPDATISQTPRLILADWLTATKNPLVARVWVNRLWHYHFGRGIVATPNDFGVKGSPPSHPELLDWLAAELIDSGWSTKHIHRLIVTSATYRQASRPNAKNARLDPDNVLLWRWVPRRLEAETIRDTMLAVSGDLDKASGGVSDEDETMSLRRTLYLFQKRERPPAIQGQFDGPSAATESNPCRHVSTVPLQALYLLNNEFGWQRAQSLARRVRASAGDDHERQVDRAFSLALNRLPDRQDREVFLSFLSRFDDGEKALVQGCHALLNLNEFLYLE